VARHTKTSVVTLNLPELPASPRAVWILLQGTFTRRVAVPVIGAIALAQGLLGWFLATQIFFRFGAYFMDAGIFSYSLASKMAPMNSPRLAPYLGDNFQSVHVFFSPLAFEKIAGLFFTIPAENFIVFLSVQQVVASVFGGLLLWLAPAYVKFRGRSIGQRWRLALAAIGALLLPLANMVLGSLLYPHPEPFGAAFAGIGLLLLFAHPGRETRLVQILGWGSLVIGVLGREDMGLHVFLTLATVWLLAPRAMWSATSGSWALRLVAPVSLLATFASSGYQSLIDLAHKSRFSDVFSGNPPYAHLMDPVKLHQRLGNLLHQRWDVLVVFGALVIAGAILRNRIILAYPLASAFWLLLNVTAVDPAKAVLGTYNQFALVTYLAAPVVLLALLGWQKSGGLVVALTVLAFGVSGVMPGPVGGGYVWSWVTDGRWVSDSQMHQVESKLVALQRSTPGLVVDDGVFSIDPVLTRHNIMSEDKRGASGMKALVWLPKYSMGAANIHRLLEAAASRGERISVECLAPEVAVARFSGIGQSRLSSPEIAWDTAAKCAD